MIFKVHYDSSSSVTVGLSICFLAVTTVVLLSQSSAQLVHHRNVPKKMNQHYLHTFTPNCHGAAFVLDPVILSLAFHDD